MTLLSVENLTIQFHGSAAPTVHNLSFSIEKGKTTALVGESGSGKSITALSLLKLNPALFYPSGKVTFDNRNLIALSEKALQPIRGNAISMIFQEPMSALNPLHTIGKQLAEAITLHHPKISRSDTALRLTALLQEVGLGYLQERMDNYPHHLSGGERQRVMIAMAIANRPALLIADEPTTALDLTTQSTIISLLKELQQTYDMALLLISHDLHLVRDIAHNVVVMQKGVAVESANVANLFSNPQHSYTKTLLASRHATYPDSNANSETSEILSCSKLCVSYNIKQGFQFKAPKLKTILKDIDLAINNSQTIGIIGESGSGKTTLGLALARLIASQGEIYFAQQRIDNLPISQLKPVRRQLQFVFQDPFSSLNPRMTIEQIISEGLNVHCPEINQKQKKDKVCTILEQVGLQPDMISRYPHEFSGGQRQRINIARAMILKPSLVIFDEPTSALDITLQAQTIHLLKTFQSDQNISYIFISHDIHVIRSISHHLLVLKNGEIIESGAAAQVIERPKHAYTKKLMAASGLQE